uniref:L,D-transpeptidase n=1 Tax=Bordetella sputigena TaxID=1416810 RepID=UPI0039F0E034
MLACASLAPASATIAAPPTPDDLAAAYRRMVRQRLSPPPSESAYYGLRALLMLREAGIYLASPQYVVVVDRNPHVQAIFIFWLDPAKGERLIGASPVSTGRIGQFDHFQTPIGVFDHTVLDGDFRAEGTKNEFGIRGYGSKGKRVFDFGWQEAERGWGNGGSGTMRLQMHATDPSILEPRLGSVQSKGCVRIPGGLNTFLDHFGVLDADYEAALAAGERVWVLPPDREPAAGAGRYLVILDSARANRPAWSPPPR